MEVAQRLRHVIMNRRGGPLVLGVSYLGGIATGRVGGRGVNDEPTRGPAAGRKSRRSASDRRLETDSDETSNAWWRDIGALTHVPYRMVLYNLNLWT